MTPEEKASARARVMEKVRRAGPWPLSLLASDRDWSRRRGSVSDREVLRLPPVQPAAGWQEHFGRPPRVMAEDGTQ